MNDWLYNLPSWQFHLLIVGGLTAAGCLCAYLFARLTTTDWGY